MESLIWMLVFMFWVIIFVSVMFLPFVTFLTEYLIIKIKNVFNDIEEEKENGN